MPSGTFFIDPFSFFPDVDCCIHIPVHPISTSTNIHSIRQCQFLFLMSAYTADLTGCKITVYFDQIFSSFLQFIFQHRQKQAISIIMYTFSKMKSSCHPFQIQIFHAYCIEALSKTGKVFSGWLPADCHRFQFPFF